MNKKTFPVFFIVFAILAFIALVYHVFSIYHPETPAPIINAAASFRHAIFVAINLVCIYGCLKRPGWFIFFIALLTLQQWYSHGSYAIEFWRTKHSIHWISVADIILLPLLLILLLADRKNKLKA